mgnify:FL=1
MAKTLRISEDLSKEERIKKEERRLRKIYKDIDKDNKALVDGLIVRAAFMRIMLEDWEGDISEKGPTEMFTQSEKVDPYERERPIVRLYNQMNKNYQSIMAQLSSLVPKPEPKKKDQSDGFEEFINGRDD